MKYVVIIFLLSNTVWSQNLDAHLWENRVIVISADKANIQKAESQFNLLNKEKEKLIDRRLVIYKCIEKTCVFYDFKQVEKMSKTNKNPEGFSITLIGLDGGKKYKSNQIEQANVFFDLIDKMPMRRQELKNKKGKND
ncbi:DUF4174 domain-containing protein [Hyunsoonleella flava]|uniref:DUF4174 domain-containing protein n=1 Tax=Hyunsoonleella flava TaxID=2527939 RepID=A0A4V2JAF1_9FLAO|nr:DUF4174 domain-containing protein [Hyunsoonleella flava]TBN05404.1 DUF4174 domain-containing protein [Hyunsoonleella flava]